MGSGQISFTLYPRKTKDRKRIWYYRVVDASGRSSGRSTRQTNKGAARVYATELLRSGKLNRHDPLFEEYTKDWWTWERCRYVRLKRLEGRISRSYVEVRRGYLEHHILPRFGKLPLSQITVKGIEDWKPGLLQKIGRYGRPLSPITVNEALSTLRIILEEAVRLQDLSFNPCSSVRRLAEKRERKSFLTREEIKALFDEARFQQVWKGDLRHFTINLLAATSGMRMGEIQGLQRRCVFPGYIQVEHAWERKFGIKEPKCGSRRVVPVPSMTTAFLERVMSLAGCREPQDLVFCNSTLKNPIDHRCIQRRLYRALRAIGISEEQRTQRHVTFHSWRVFYNTLLRGKIPDVKLRLLTGHKSEAMTDHYTNFQLEDFQDVVEIQEKLFQA